MELNWSWSVLQLELEIEVEVELKLKLRRKLDLEIYQELRRIMELNHDTGLCKDVVCYDHHKI